MKKVISKLIQKINDLKFWFLNRTVHKYHIVELGFKPGYADVDYRMAISIFVLLNHFVEKEDGLKDYINFKSNIFEFDKFDEHLEAHYSNVADIYSGLYKAYLWWKKNGKSYKDDEFLLDLEKQNEMTKHLVFIVTNRGILWT